MYLTYIDEVKFDNISEKYYWLCGLAFPEGSIKKLEQSLSKISQDYFGSAILTTETEFHASHIVHGKGQYKGHALTNRFELYKSLLDALNNCQDLKKIVVRINPAKMVAGNFQDKAFMFFVERVNSLMGTLQSTALLISDHDKDMVSSNVTSLSTYKEQGTKYEFGSEINNIVDTIHHTHSHHSRLIQMADLITYTIALEAKPDLNFPRKEILEYAKSETTLLNADKYKYWPTDDSWALRYL